MTEKLKVATTSLAGCFGCHMSFLDIDERLVALAEVTEFDRSPLTDIEHCHACDMAYGLGSSAQPSSAAGSAFCDKPWR